MPPKSFLGNVVSFAKIPDWDFLGLGFMQDTHDLFVGKSLVHRVLLG